MMVRALCRCVLALCLLVGVAHAAVEVPASQAQAIEAARNGLDGAGLTEVQYKEAKELLDAAAKLEQEAEPLATKLAGLGETAQSFTPDMPVQLTVAELQKQLQQWIGRLPKNADVDALERLLTEERNTVAVLKTQIDSVSGELADLISRPGQIMLTAVGASPTNTHETVSDVQVKQGDEPPALQTARQLQRLAAQRLAALELAVHEAEKNTADIRQRQLEVQLRTLQQEQALRAPRIEWLSQRIAQASQQQLQEQANQQAGLAKSSAALGNAAVQALANHNANLAQQLLDETDSLAKERRALTDYERQREQVTAVLRDLQARLRLGGSGTTIGPWLWQQWQNVPSLLALDTQRKDVQQRIAELRLRLYSSTEERYALTRAPQASASGTKPATDMVGVLSAGAPAAGTASAADLQPWQITQAALLDQLEPLLRRRIAVLEQTDEALRVLSTQGKELRTVMDQNLLWMPSHKPIGLQWLGEWNAQKITESSLSATVWAGLWALTADVKNHPFFYLMWGVVFSVLVLLRLLAPKRLRAIHQHMGNVMQDRFVFTLQALVWSLLIALPSAVAAWWLGGVLQEVGARHAEPIEALGRVLVQLSAPLLLTGLLGALIHPDGLGIVHLGWPQALVRTVRRAWLAAMAILVPAAVFMSVLALHTNTNITISTQGRLVVMVMAAGLAVLARSFIQSMEQWSANYRSMLVRAMEWLLPGALAGTALLAAMGYVFTGAILLQTLLNSMIVVLIVSIIDGLLHRWLLLGERHLALKRLHEQQERESATAQDPETGEALSDAEHEIELVKVSAQSRRLLRLLRIVLLLLGLLWAWAEVLPALSRFDNVVLWHSTTGAAGKEVTTPISLKNVLTSAAILLLTFSMVRNLPGVLELALASSRRVSAATRYTVTTLVRYAISIVGCLIAFGLLGLRWGQLQWMAAALSVGLGFGMQEIFANFISGLILLVERPFRVGDRVTVGNLTGTVTRIRTRAATVLDYDNKEIIIPNKSFITGQVTNWTLSDSMTRLVLKVGAAYGSPPEQVRALLLRAANEHPNVLREPAPNAWFIALGDNALEFELRVYVATLAERMPICNDLNRRITELLGDAGIEIAFPQLDLHVRDVPASLQPQKVAVPPSTKQEN